MQTSTIGILQQVRLDSVDCYYWNSATGTAGQFRLSLLEFSIKYGSDRLLLLEFCIRYGWIVQSVTARILQLLLEFCCRYEWIVKTVTAGDQYQVQQGSGGCSSKIWYQVQLWSANFVQLDG